MFYPKTYMYITYTKIITIFWHKYTYFNHKKGEEYEKRNFLY